MKWVIFAALISICFGADRWDISNTNSYQYRDVMPDHHTVPKKGHGRGPASLAPRGAFEPRMDVPIPTSFSIIATKDMFEPNVIVAPLGKEIEISLVTEEMESCFVLSELGIRKGLKKGSRYKILIAPQHQDKEYTFHCALNNLKGKIIFTDQTTER